MQLCWLEPGSEQTLQVLARASTLKKLWNKYIWAFENGDPRMNSRLLVHLPLPVILLSVFYLLVVASPCFMSGWECLRFAGSLAAYSPGLVALSGYIFYEVFFILQKKPEHITFLHVCHVLQTVGWRQICVTWSTFFVRMLNALVPIFTCLYYGLASLGPCVRAALPVVEVTFNHPSAGSVATVAHSSYSHFTECSFPDGFNMAVLLCSLSVISLFLNCYHQTYLRGKREKLTSGAGPKD